MRHFCKTSSGIRMAESQLIDSAILKKTQDMLGQLIRKSVLTDKLLSKPPFRFVHDVITSVNSKKTFLLISTETDLTPVTVVYCGQTVEWIKMPLYGSRPQSRPYCVRWDTAPPQPLPTERDTQQLPHFRSLRTQASLRP